MGPSCRSRPGWFDSARRANSFLRSQWAYGYGRLAIGTCRGVAEQNSSLQEDHLTHAIFDFPSTLEELTSGRVASNGPLQEELERLGMPTQPSASELVSWAPHLDRVGEKLTQMAFSSLEFSQVPGINALSGICSEVEALLGSESEAPDLLTEASILKAGYEQAQKALKALNSDTTGYLERFVKSPEETRSAQLKALIEEANQFQFRRKPIHSLVEITGNHNSIKLLDQAEALRGHLEAGGKFKTLLGAQAGEEAEGLLECTRVNDSAISNKEQLAGAIDYLNETACSTRTVGSQSWFRGRTERSAGLD